MGEKENSMKNFVSEFKKFIARGNVMDLAVGVIIGGAFKAIVDSLVNDIISPVIGLFSGDTLNSSVLMCPSPTAHSSLP